MSDDRFDEITRVTKEWIKNHPFDPDAYIRYIQSDEWKLPEVFTYAKIS